MNLLESSIAGYNTSYIIPPEDYTAFCERAGRIEEFSYTTLSYLRGGKEKLDKTCLIYLPYGYNDGTKYDIVYYMHGASGSSRSVIGGVGQSTELSRMLDNAIASGIIKPVIMVFSSYYEHDGDNDDVVGYETAVELQRIYYKEFINDLMPAVESRYSTFAKSVNKEDLIASREHRALSGYSAGGSVVWYEFDHALEYAKWYLNFSGTYKASENGKNASSEEIAGHLEDTIGKFLSLGYKKSDFFIYIAVGDEKDKNYEKISSNFTAMMELNKKTETYSYGDNAEENNLLFCKTDHCHGYGANVPQLYCALKTVMKK